MGCNIDEASSPLQLFQCAGAELGDSLLMTKPNIASESLSQLLTAMRSLAVIPVATCVLRIDLLQLRQERDEAIRAFAARDHRKAETCAFAAQCECGKSVNYTDNAIRDVLLNGLADTDITREILGMKDILTKPINDIIALIEGKEMACNALPSSTLSAVSTFQNQRNTAPVTAPPQADRNKEAVCLDCKTTFKIFTAGVRGWNNPTRSASTATAPVAGESTKNALPRIPRQTYRPWKQIPSPRSWHFRQVQPVHTTSADGVAEPAVVLHTVRSTSLYHPV